MNYNFHFSKIKFIIIVLRYQFLAQYRGFCKDPSTCYSTTLTIVFREHTYICIMLHSFFSCSLIILNLSHIHCITHSLWIVYWIPRTLTVVFGGQTHKGVLNTEQMCLDWSHFTALFRQPFHFESFLPHWQSFSESRHIDVNVPVYFKTFTVLCSLFKCLCFF